MSESSEGVPLEMANVAAEKPLIYGMGASGKHEYTDVNRSGLPESYADTILSLVTTETQINGGIFVDVGGGTGELGKSVEENSGIKSLTLDRSLVGMSGNDIKNGVVAEATAFPIPDQVAGVVHAKDLIEHLDDTELSNLATEAKRILVPSGKLVITEKNYYPNFPINEKPHTTVEIGKHKIEEIILPGENFNQARKRLIGKYGDTVIFNPPYFPRSKDNIVTEFKKLGFKCEKSIKWETKKGEPDWFGSPTGRNILVFTPISTPKV